MEKFGRIFLVATLFAIVSVVFTACGGGTSSNSSSGGMDPNETAATVNGKAIKNEEVERVFKMQAQGQDARMSPLELANSRLQVLSGLIEQEVLFQKAEKEGVVPTDEEVTAELNKQKTQSGKSAEQLEKEMKDAGMDDATVRLQLKKTIAIQKLFDKITGKIEPPKDNEIEKFYEGNKEAFVKKKGVKLAAIVIDPANNGEGDVTVDQASAMARGDEIVKQLQAGADFASVAREKSEDQSRFQGGDLGYASEEDLRQTFPGDVVEALMNPKTEIGKLFITRAQGKFFILKLQERSDRDEALTLESPGVRQQVTDALISAKKQLLQAAYQTIAMSEAKIDNMLARKIVNNPNELSGARPAGIAAPANANSNANANAAVAPANASANTNANTNADKANAAPNGNAKPAANAAKPAANAAKK
ncbi:MAG TPA: SurA N-terminal domain-containing protein [Pyrinomonadaceae bacterium]|nr:SurA N-terminal domain-containing protein [Pyrinomonadaceae bacterium]